MYANFKVFKPLADIAVDRVPFLRDAHVDTAMVYIVWLHYALRILLTLFDRLKSLRMVRVEPTFVCCHVLLIRVILAQPQQPLDRRLRAIVLCFRTPSRLVAAMKPSTLARCAITNEYLRRRKQTFCNAATHSHPEHHVDLLSIAFEQVPEELQTGAEGKTASDHTQALVSPTANEYRDTDPTAVRLVALNEISTATTHHRKSSVWKPRLMGDRTSSAVLEALQLNAERSAPATPTSSDKDACTEATVLLERDTTAKASRMMANHDYQTFAAFHFPTIEYTSALQVSSPSLHPEDARDTASPTSDTTLFEDAPVCPISELGYDEGIGAYTTGNDTSKESLPFSWNSHMEEHETNPVAKRGSRHRRYVSSHSSFDAAQTPSIPLRSRSRTNDGLLLFKANSSKEPTDNATKNRHRRKVSLNLPVNAHVNPGHNDWEFQKPGVKSWNKPTTDMETAHYATGIETLTSQERELEYKHRHTFIGTGSLDDFLEVLETAPNHNVTKAAVARAFVQLASSEQLYARQCSSRTNGWDLVSRTTLNVMDVTSVDYVVQLHVKLGSITLRQFMNLIPFDDFNEVAAMRVVEAFSVASHIDATAGIGARSKARAFRRWLVEQKNMDADC